MWADIRMRPIAMGITTLYGLLGAKRGVEYYDKKFRRSSAPFYYTDAAVAAVIGTFLYVNPVLVPFTAYEEIKALEQSARGL